MNLKKCALLLLVVMFALANVAGAQSAKSKSKTRKSAKTAKTQPAAKTEPSSPTIAAQPATSSAADNHQAEAEFPRITVDELKEKIAKNAPVFIIDSRSQGSYDNSEIKIKGAVRILADEIEARLSEIPRDREVVIYCTCSSEQTSIRVGQKLFAKGYKQVRALKGGWDAWVEAAGPAEPKQ